VVRREVQAHHPIEEIDGFTGREAQVRLAQFGQLTTRAQASQGQRRSGAGSDHQMQLRRQMVEQKGESVVDRLSRDEVIVVEISGEHQSRSPSINMRNCRAVPAACPCQWLFI